MGLNWIIHSIYDTGLTDTGLIDETGLAGNGLIYVTGVIVQNNRLVHLNDTDH